jgi:hypothetical protein
METFCEGYPGARLPQLLRFGAAALIRSPQANKLGPVETNMVRPEITNHAPDEVAPAEKKKGERKRRKLGPPSHAFTVQEFCDAHRISRSQYYELKKLGRGPAETRALDKIIITQESAAAWRRKHTTPARARGRRDALGL